MTETQKTVVRLKIYDFPCTCPKILVPLRTFGVHVANLTQRAQNIINP